MPRNTYIPVRSRNIGRGKHMDHVVLKKVLLFACNHRPCELEKVMGLKHGTAVRACAKVRELNLTQERLGTMTPTQVAELYYARKKAAGTAAAQEKIMPDLALLQEKWQLTRPQGSMPRERKLALTMQLIVEKYYFELPENVEQHKRGKVFLSESHVLRLWRAYRRNNVAPAYRVPHEPGKEVEYDFCGVKLRYYQDNQPQDATILVGVLPASGHFYVKAIADQSLPQVCTAVADSFRYWGGCPEVIRVDNFKAAVNTASRYGGTLNDDFAAMARFFNCEVFTCRSRSPKDKSTSEAVVKYVTRYALAKANHYLNEGGRFNSLKELNDYLKPITDKMLQRPIRGLKKSRAQLFEEDERPALNIPSSWDYRYVRTASATVPADGRILLHQHYYALPSQWIRQKIIIELTSDTVRFTHEGTLIAAYPRLDNRPGLSTREDYTPKEHLIYDIFSIGNQDSMLLQWARAIGTDTEAWCREALNGKGRYADTVRHVHAVLSLPQAYTELYQELNQCIKEQRSLSLYKVSAGTIVRAWKDMPHSFSGPKDSCFTPDTYFRCGKDVLTGKREVMGWFTSPVTQTSPKSVSEHLHGSSMYSRRYAAIKAALTGSTPDIDKTAE